MRYKVKFCVIFVAIVILMTTNLVYSKEKNTSRESKAYPIALTIEKPSNPKDPVKVNWSPNDLSGIFSKEEFPAYALGKLKKKWVPKPNMIPAGEFTVKPLSEAPPLVFADLAPGHYALCIRVGVNDPKGGKMYPLGPSFQKSNWVVFEIKK